jgi:hypothetical protein
MMPLRRPHIAALTALAATAALAVGAPAASASTVPTSPFSVATAFARFQTTQLSVPSFPVSVPPGSCSTFVGAEGQGRTGGVEVSACGTSFIGPITQISNVMGPTIITGSFAGSSIVSGGNVAIGP